MSQTRLYERDYFAWTREQAHELRRAASSRHNEPIDYENIAEEIEGLGRSDKRALESALANLLSHLAKLEFSRDREPRAGWRATVKEQRRLIAATIADSPSLAAYPGSIRAEAWDIARTRAAADLGIDDDEMPAALPYAIDLVLRAGWLPANRHGLD